MKKIKKLLFFSNKVMAFDKKGKEMSKIKPTNLIKRYTSGKVKIFVGVKERKKR